MTKLIHKRISLLFIKYSPAIMAVICSVKLFMYYIGQYKLVHYINSALNIFIVCGVYSLGRTFGYCWKHRSLCRTVLWGYIVYTASLVIGIDDEYLLIPAALYIILVLVMTLLYKNL